MDSRIYFHQYRRPRYENPTYTSSNVQNSMTFFNGAYYPEPKSVKQPNRRYTIEGAPSRDHVPTPPLKSSNYNTIDEPVSSSYRENSGRQQNSKLSNYGQRTLQLDQKGIYQKQSSPYNIINLKPKEFNTNIRQYPWFSIENRDDVFYKRMTEEYKEKAFYNSRAKSFERPPPVDTSIAGKHTYDLQPKVSMNPQRKQKQYFTAKMLNHMDQLQHNLA